MIKKILIVSALILGLAYWYNSSQIKIDDKLVGIANPASVYCVEQGGRSEIRNNPDGSQVGACVFSDNSECDEWAFFRKECVKGNK